MGGCKFYIKKKKTDWVSALLHSKFFGSCVDHRDLRKNEKNVFCIDCSLCCCRHCMSSSVHWLHRKLQICKYVYHDVIRFQDMHKHLDCSRIQTYKINGEKAIHLNPRPQSKDFKPSKSKGGSSCEACGRYIQDQPNCFCSIACKVSVCEKSEDQTPKIFPLPIPELGDLSLKETYSPDEENVAEKDSCISVGTSSDEAQAFVSSVLKPRKQMHKRKGIPRRAPLC
ncbi:protein RGF1 INDUCIBLE TRANSCRIPTION FACTOR 1 [Malania oleifera]|uniref:protein RGF1 INDUCIBLE TRANSCRIPTION FACTOR 1 n=1 Tax=Malania oleifera TaxID=397392 RepID=UPI0025AE9E36|nr:protein RGF1 INDUCIBLE TRANSCRIPTION FACTOR 1 [Malania oleifera]